MRPFFHFNNTVLPTMPSISGPSKPWSNPASCFLFDGSNDYIDFSNIIDLSTQSVAFTAWVKALPNIQGAFVYRGWYGEEGWYSQFYDQKIQVLHDTTFVFSAPITSFNGQWKNIVLQHELSGEWSFYIDGNLISPTIQLTGNPVLTGHPFRVSYAGYVPIIKLSELCWFGDTLSQEAITVLASKSWNEELQSKIVSAWPCDTQVGSVMVIDHVLGNDGQIYNGQPSFYDTDTPYA